MRNFYSYALDTVTPAEISVAGGAATVIVALGSSPLVAVTITVGSIVASTIFDYVRS